MTDIGHQIKQARRNKGLSQEELGRAIGTTKSAISKYELGHRDPSLEQLQHIAEILDVSITELVGLEQIDRNMLAHEAGPEVYRKIEENYQRHHVECGRISMDESNRLLVALGLIEEGQDLSDDDLAFLEHIIGQLNVWFGKRRKRPETTPQSPQAPQEGTDTTSTPDALETPSEGE